MSERNWECNGTVEVTVDGLSLSLVAEGQDLRLETDRPGAIFRRINSSKTQRIQATRRLAEDLYRTNLTLRIRTKGRTTVVLGRDARAGVASKLLGIPHLELGLNWNTIKLVLG